MDNSIVNIPTLLDYGVTVEGKVWSYKSDRWLTPYITPEGYSRFSFQVNNKQIRVLLHRLLAFVFLDLTDLYDYTVDVHHIDEDKTNNKLRNLKVLSKLEHKKIHTRVMVESECISCGKLLDRPRKTQTCINCLRKNTSSITLEDILFALYTNKSWLKAAKDLGISDNGLRKKYVKLSGNSYKEAKEHAGKVFMDTCRSSKPK